ncbi:MAG: RnfH family protein [Gallionellaceae bacterium CG1_02_56_997]|nr:MAG: RnfH family protein [Gallionellaceae bacterium CG1_02_56_997]
MSDNINVEVVYALPHQQTLLKLAVPPGTTAQDAVMVSGILEKHPEIDLSKTRLGIFGKPTKPDAVLRELDRVEIYRPLLADPKEVRRRRAEEGKVMKKGGGDA